MAAGLTMGTVSLDPIDLRVRMRCGTPREAADAEKLLRLAEHEPHHHLLVTLLLLNACANEAMPLFLDKLVPSYVAILISVTLVLFAGEIIPAAIFTGPSRLRLAASLSGLVRFLMLLMSPIAWPLAVVLDKLVPEETELVSRKEVIALSEVQREFARERGRPEGEEFDEDEVDLVRGALSLAQVKVEEVRSPQFASPSPPGRPAARQCLRTCIPAPPPCPFLSARVNHTPHRHFLIPLSEPTQPD